MINDPGSARFPPLDRVVTLAAGDNDPERLRPMHNLLNLREPRLLKQRNMNIAAKHARPYAKAQPFRCAMDPWMEWYGALLLWLISGYSQSTVSIDVLAE